MLGTYVSRVSGIDVFGRLDDGIALEINPGLPREETFFAQGAAIKATRILGQAVGLTRALASRGTDLAERMSKFEGYLVLVRCSSGKLVTIRPDDAADQLVVFTTFEDANAFVPRFGLDDIAITPVAADRLIALLAQQKSGCYLCTMDGEVRQLPAGVFELLAEPI
jgi:hypothetical protein